MSCDFHALATPGVQRLHPYEPGKPMEELERELGIRDVVKLASNENPLGPSPRALQAIQAHLPELARYPDGNGYVLKQALSHRLDVPAEQLTLGNGSNDVLEFIVRVFATPAHEVVCSQHAFAVYPISSQSVGARVVSVPARDYGHDLQAMADAINERTCLVFIANPNNPTGTWVDADALAGFLERVPEHVLVVVDEAYREYVDEPDYPDCVQWLPAHANLVVTRTFSKAYGLAGLRIGYAVSNPQVADLMNRVRQPFNVNSLGLVAAAAALEDREHVERGLAVNRTGMRFLRDNLQRLGLQYIPSIGNFLTARMPRSGAEVYQALLREGVIVRPLGAYGMPDHLRISIGTEAENRRLVAALERVL
ncbi:MAG: histidinol-phosphate transaminase [Gammaproteobacteria bacterium]|nr:histidinol-phosphate transaminase [Gammaproteobacteria bacterium]